MQEYRVHRRAWRRLLLRCKIGILGFGALLTATVLLAEQKTAQYSTIQKAHRESGVPLNAAPI